MSYIPRAERDHERIRRVAAAVRTDGASAMEAALAQIGAAFDEAAAINGFKIRVERLFRLGPHHPAPRARFGARATALTGRNLNEAIAAVERWWRDERKAFQVASALGYGTRLSLDMLRELRLILRLMQFKRMDGEFRLIAAALCDRPLAMAAE
jgi:hypothetical protein